MTGGLVDVGGVVAGGGLVSDGSSVVGGIAAGEFTPEIDEVPSDDDVQLTKFKQTKNKTKR